MDKLINCLYSQPNATTRLICFPWAGGGSLYNTQWGRLFDDSVEVYSLRFPGRESRSREPFPHSLDQLLDDIIDVLLPFLREKRFAFFGHSFGSFNSYATAARLKEKYGLQPIHLFVSGVSAPRSPYSSSSQKKSELSDEDFLKWMAVKQGTPPELLHDEEAIQLFLPLMKTDLKLLENHVNLYLQVTSPIVVMGIEYWKGLAMFPITLAAWKDLTSGDFNIHMLPGGHFYLRDSKNEKSLVQYISRYMEAAEMKYL